MSNTNNETQTTSGRKKIDYEGRIVLDFSPSEIAEIKRVMEKEHIPFKKTMVYIMVKKYIDIYNAEHNIE